MKPFAKREHLNKFGTIAFLALCLCATAGLAQQPFRIENSAVAAHQVSYLSWTPLGEDCVYHLFRRYPDSAAYTPVAVLSQTHYYDTLGRTICADTVKYYIRAHTDTAALVTDTAALFHHDDLPTTPCALRLCSVDTLTGQILLSWYPSPDPDVMGYFIVQGSPSRGLDTVWGRLNTSYLCSADLTGPFVESQYDFRILAFDSCYQASPLTPYYHNPVLQLTDPGCSRWLRCSWNEYTNMPGGVGQYRIHYRLPGHDADRIFAVAADSPRTFDTLIPDLSVTAVQIFLEVRDAADTLSAYSAVSTFLYPAVATPQHLAITQGTYSDTEPSVRLTLALDSAYAGTEITLYRRKSSERTLQPLALLPHDPGQTEVVYIDRDIHRAEPYYVYQAEAADPCRLARVLSDTLRVDLPEVYDPAAYLPNAIIYAHPQLGALCPSILSPLADGYQMSIYNRFGERVFTTTSITDCWTGLSPAGRPLPQGTYIYLITCRHADGSTRKYKGTVTLLH